MIPGRVSCCRCRHGLTQFDAGALDIADPETPADQVIEPHPPDDHLAARLRPGQACVLQRLGLHQRQRLARLRAIGAEVPVAPQPLTRERRNRPDRHERLAWADIDLLDMHKPIMPAAAGPATPIAGRRVAVESPTRSR